MKIKLSHKFKDIVNIDNLLEAWQEFIRGKRNKLDVQKFSFCLMDNILSLHQNLINHNYKHGRYQYFKINDPKLRTIHKASVRDRLLHHAVHRKLYPFFDKNFISDSLPTRFVAATCTLFATAWPRWMSAHASCQLPSVGSSLVG